MNDTLTAFIAARLGEDEAAANAAARVYGKDWHLEASDPTRVGVHDADFGSPVVLDVEGVEPASFIVRFDPRRVLREVEAKRAILAAHPLTDKIVGYIRHDFTFGCETCNDFDGETVGGGYCDTLKALAGVWSNHPDYQAGWAAGLQSD